MRDDEFVATNCEVSRSSSLSGLNTATTEFAPMPSIIGNITLIDPQSSSTSSNITIATTANTACGNVKAKPDFVSDDEPYIIITPKTVVTSSYDYSDLLDLSKETGSQFASHGNDEDVHTL